MRRAVSAEQVCFCVCECVHQLCLCHCFPGVLTRAAYDYLQDRVHDVLPGDAHCRLCIQQCNTLLSALGTHDPMSDEQIEHMCCASLFSLIMFVRSFSCQRAGTRAFLRICFGCTSGAKMWSISARCFCGGSSRCLPNWLQVPAEFVSDVSEVNCW
jgi:hypothetical protein